MLMEQRRLVAQAAAPANGSCGQNLDMALLLVDGPSGRVDPAFEAHLTPIVEWSRAIWNAWIPEDIRQVSCDSAVAALRTAKQP